MMSAGLPTLIARPFPADVKDWRMGSYLEIARLVRDMAPMLEAIERGRADEWIAVWRVPVGIDGPTLDEAEPCSRDKEFLSRHQSECWYYLAIKSEVAGRERHQYFRCRWRPGEDAGRGESRDKADLLRTLDTQTALAQTEAARADKAREDADRWHSESLAKDVTISELKIKVGQLEAELEDAIAEQSPALSDEAADKLFAGTLALIKQWAITPTDKGFAAAALKASLRLMSAIEGDAMILRLVLQRHRPAFRVYVAALNDVATNIGIKAQVEVPRMPRLATAPRKGSRNGHP